MAVATLTVFAVACCVRLRFVTGLVEQTAGTSELEAHAVQTGDRDQWLSEP